MARKCNAVWRKKARCLGVLTISDAVEGGGVEGGADVALPDGEVAVPGLGDEQIPVVQLHSSARLSVSLAALQWMQVGARAACS